MVVIKIGGEAAMAENSFAKFLSVLKDNLPAAVVFGAGVQINARLKEENIHFEFYGGERATTPEMLAVIEEEFAKMASRIAGLLGDIESVFVRGSEVFTARAKSAHLGLVGEVTRVSAGKIKDSGVPCVLVSPLASDGEGGLLNVNADVSASALARELKAEKMIFITKPEAVMDGENRPVLSLNGKEALKMISSGVISAGMIPKIKSAVETLEAGVGEVVIGSTHITR